MKYFLSKAFHSIPRFYQLKAQRSGFQLERRSRFARERFTFSETRNLQSVLRRSCGKATAVATVHWTVAKSRLSSPFWFSRPYAVQSFEVLSRSSGFAEVGGPKWTRTIDLTIISRVL